MAKHKKKAKVNIPMCTAFVLFCMMLISFHATSGLYAKYLVAASAEDAARVITFGDLTLTESGDFNADGTMMIIPGVSLQKKAVVDFAGSEAATYLFVEVMLSSAWQTADNTTFSVHSGEKTLMQWRMADGWKLLKAESGVYVYYCELIPNTVFSADVIADNGNVFVSEYITQNEIRSMTDISMKLRAAVVQSSGFDSPGAAWQSIEAKDG